MHMELRAGPPQVPLVGIAVNHVCWQAQGRPEEGGCPSTRQFLHWLEDRARHDPRVDGVVDGRAVLSDGVEHLPELGELVRYLREDVRHPPLEPVVACMGHASCAHHPFGED